MIHLQAEIVPHPLKDARDCANFGLFKLLSRCQLLFQCLPRDPLHRHKREFLGFSYLIDSYYVGVVD